MNATKTRIYEVISWSQPHRGEAKATIGSFRDVRRWVFSRFTFEVDIDLDNATDMELAEFDAQYDQYAGGVIEIPEAIEEHLYLAPTVEAAEAVEEWFKNLILPVSAPTVAIERELVESLACHSWLSEYEPRTFAQVLDLLETEEEA